MPATSVNLLRSVPLFSGMTDTAVEAIRELVEPQDYEAGETLTRQGEPGDQFLVLSRGRARVEQDGQFIRDLGPGDFLGEISLLDDRPRTATVVALEPIHALTIHRERFRELLDRHPAIRYSVISALTERVRTSPLPTD